MIRKALYWVMLLALFFSAFGMENIPPVYAQDGGTEEPVATESPVQETPTPEPEETVTPPAETTVEVTITPQPTTDEQVTVTATPSPEVEAQIVGGTEADPGEYPWQVALVGGTSTGFYWGAGYQFCGGTLIAAQWVLTAAHCITEDDGSVSPVNSLDVVAGIWDLEYPTSGYQRRDVIQIIRHPSYNGYTKDNDIALLKLSSPVSLGGSGATKTAVIPLVPSTIGSLTGSSSWVTGWGNTETNNYYGWGSPPRLREAEVPIIANSICNDANHYGGRINDNMMCAGYDAGGKDSCQGDSGGPLIVSNSGQWQLAGVVSWGNGCADPYSQGVYARVSRYVDWIAFMQDPAILTYPLQGSSIGAIYSPTFTWNKVNAANWYRLYVSGPSGVVFDQWLDASQVCSGSVCTTNLGPSIMLGGGSHQWYVQTYSATLGYGPWSNDTQPTNFTVTSPSAPVAAVLTEPKGNILENYTPTYKWGKVGTATYYRLYVSGPSGVVLDQWYKSADICDSPTANVCSVASPALVGGNYAWYVQTYNPAGYGPWSNTDANGVVQPTNFNTSTTVPVAAVLTEPKGDITTNFYPTYKWGKVGTATYYRLYVSGPGGVVLDQWYKAADICDNPTAGVCQVPSPRLGVGAHAWYVQTYSPAGYGTWSNTNANGVIQPTNFSTAMPAILTEQPTLTYPITNIFENYNPEYTWNKVTGALYYHLYVSGPAGLVLDQWYEALSICSDVDNKCRVASPTLAGGSYAWYVQSWNLAGYGPWSNTNASGVVQPTNFSTTTTVPIAAILTEPKGDIATNYTPTYKWGKVSTATYYRLYVSGPSGVVLDKWYKAVDICDNPTAGVCQVASSTLVGGSYGWYVQTYSPAGYGPWSNTNANGVVQPTNFNTTIPAVPAAAVLTAPKNDIGTDYNPTYTWPKVATATWYRLYISGPAGLVLDQWYQASSICGGDNICRVVSPTLAGGVHAWYVQTYNQSGYGPWSNTNANGVVQPTNFSTTIPSIPVGATLTAPTGTITNLTPTYTWGKVSMVTWYRLYVKDAYGVVVDKWYPSVDICNATTCSVVSPTLKRGDHTWWVQTYSGAGYGPWKGASFKVSP